MKDLQRIGFLKHLDLDTDPLYLEAGNYTDALNVRPLTDSTESSQSIVNILGNKYACSLGIVNQQNKIYALYIDSTTTIKKIFDLYNQNNIKIVDTFSFLQLGGTFTVAYNSLSFNFNSFFSSNGITCNISSKQIDANHGYLILEITNNLGLDYTLIDQTAFNSNPPSLQVIQESIDKSLTGDLQVIGSFDLLGDLFVFSTTQSNLSSTIVPTISSITAATQAIVTTNIAHGFTSLDNGKLITITGASNILYNGIFMIASITSTTTFKLAGTTLSMGNSGSGGNIQINIGGIGEIGIITQDINLDVFTYTRLVRSKKFNFITKRQIDSFVEKNSQLISIYWTDFYNNSRVLYYSGAYFLDGAITYYNSSGKYDYGSIDLSTILFSNNQPTIFTFTNQQQSGGALLSGNWRYAYRFISQGGNATEYSNLSNPIPVFKSSINSSASSMSGDDTNTLTTKVNSFNISNIPSNLYKYIELIGVNYTSSNSELGYVIRRELLGSSTNINLNHTGLESTTTLDLGTLISSKINYKTAKNIIAIDNRLVLSNLITNSIIDFTSFCKTWTHSLKIKKIPFVGLSETTLTVNEYNNPNNVYNYMGYMFNETYRFTAKFRLKDGSLTNAYYIDDILFDTSSTNINYDGITNRRISGLPNYNLTDPFDNNNVCIPYINFSNINYDYVLNGISIRNLVSEIIIERVECVKEILATGMAAMTCGGGGVVISLSDVNVYYTSNLSAKSGEFPCLNSIRDDGTIITYPGIAPADRTILSFYSPDIFYNNIGINDISSSNGDLILNYGSPRILFTDKGASSGKHYNSTYGEYDGSNGLVSLDIHPVSILSNFNSGDIKSFSGITFSKDLVTLDGSNNPNAQWFNIGSPVIKVTTSGLTNVSGSPDYGFYYIQYKRPIPYNSINNNKYGNINSNKSIPTGANIIITSDISIANINVFGGDVFTQKTYLKSRFPAAWQSGGYTNLGFGGGVSFYSQNRINTQLNKRYNNNFGNWDYPNTATVSWLEITSQQIDSVHYNTGYNPVNNINSDVSFDSTLPLTTNYPSRIIYSDIKLQDGLIDGYRNFLALNFKDLDLSFGEIVHMANGNGELITWQPRKFQRQYFNTTGVLQTSSNLNVLIGDGSVLNRNGQTLSTIGTKHKWSVIKGKSAQGNDTFYWLNTELKKAIRFGYDGTISLADMRGMQSFFANNLTWVDLQDNPADGNGICGVWNDRFMELIWCVRGKRNVAVWDSSINYAIGQVVSYVPTTFSTYEQTGEFYKAKISNVNKNPSTFTDTWDIIPHTDNNYYNEFTLAFNEQRNGFTSFYSFLPKIFLKWKDTFFSPQPTTKSNDIYLDNKGNYCIWYNDIHNIDNIIPPKIVDGYIEGVVNNQPDTVKWFEANRTNSEILPERIDYKTKTQISFITSSEINTREGNFDNTIKMDSTGLTINDSQTSRLFGKYLKVKITFKNNVYQKLFDIIIKFRNSVRLPQK